MFFLLFLYKNDSAIYYEGYEIWNYVAYFNILFLPQVFALLLVCFRHLRLNFILTYAVVIESYHCHF